MVELATSIAATRDNSAHVCDDTCNDDCDEFIDDCFNNRKQHSCVWRFPVSSLSATPFRACTVMPPLCALSSRDVADSTPWRAMVSNSKQLNVSAVQSSGDSRARYQKNSTSGKAD